MLKVLRGPTQHRSQPSMRLGRARVTWCPGAAPNSWHAPVVRGGHLAAVVTQRRRRRHPAQHGDSCGAHAASPPPPSPTARFKLAACHEAPYSSRLSAEAGPPRGCARSTPACRQAGSAHGLRVAGPFGRGTHAHWHCRRTNAPRWPSASQCRPAAACRQQTSTAAAGRAAVGEAPQSAHACQSQMVAGPLDPPPGAAAAAASLFCC